MSVDHLLGVCAENEFNAVRLPVSAELALGLDTILPADGINFDVNPGIKGKTAGQMLDAVIDGCASRGILVLLDMHHVPTAAAGITDLWYHEADGVERGEKVVAAAWTALARRYASRWNLLGADLNNEPHGRATWCCGCPATDWRGGAERLGAAVLGVAPGWLIFVEGTSDPSQCPDPCFWGGGLCHALEKPVRLPVEVRKRAGGERGGGEGGVRAPLQTRVPPCSAGTPRVLSARVRTR